MKITKLKSNKGFTLQDVVVAIIIIFIFVGVVASLFIVIYKVESETKVDVVAMLVVVQAMERIDKLGYNEVQESTLSSVISTMRTDFSIPESFNISMRIIPDSLTDELVKTVEFKLNYHIFTRDRNIVIRTLKIKEFEGES